MAVATKAPKYDVTDLELADAGVRRTEWPRARCRCFPDTRAGREGAPVRGHPDRGVPARDDGDGESRLALRDGGAEVALCASNPLSTQDDAAASLVAREGIAVFAKRARTATRTSGTSTRSRDKAADHDGRRRRRGDALHTERRELLPGVKGGTEETTTGVIRLRAMSEEGVLAYRSSP